MTPRSQCCSLISRLTTQTMEPSSIPAAPETLGARHGEAVVEWAFSAQTRKLLLVLRTPSDVVAAAPQSSALLQLQFGSLTVRGIIISARAGEGRYERYDFVSRYFAPWNGIDEDPVTGSAHTVLGPFWAERLNRTVLCALQASARGGTLLVNVRRDQRVELRGSAVTVLRGTLIVPQ